MDDRSTNPGLDPSTLLARSLKIRCFVAFGSRLDEARLAEHLPDHIHWVMSLEKEGRVLLCGPLSPKKGSSGPNSMLVLRAESLQAAEELAREDPLVREKVVSFEMREWTIYEGAIPLYVSISDGSVHL